MIDFHPADILLKDQLSRETRTERRTLLAASAIGIVIVKTGLVPSKISALGIEFNQTDQRSLLSAMAAIIIYFLVAFLIYAGSDFLIWRITFRESLKASLAKSSVSLNDFADHERKRMIHLEEKLRGRVWQVASRPMSVLRAVFEFGVPVFISIYAVILLLRARV